MASTNSNVIEVLSSPPGVDVVPSGREVLLYPGETQILGDSVDPAQVRILRGDAASPPLPIDIDLVGGVEGDVALSFDQDTYQVEMPTGATFVDAPILSGNVTITAISAATLAAIANVPLTIEPTATLPTGFTFTQDPQNDNLFRITYTGDRPTTPISFALRASLPSSTFNRSASAVATVAVLINPPPTRTAVALPDRTVTNLDSFDINVAALFTTTSGQLSYTSISSNLLAGTVSEVSVGSATVQPVAHGVTNITFFAFNADNSASASASFQLTVDILGGQTIAWSGEGYDAADSRYEFTKELGAADLNVGVITATSTADDVGNVAGGVTYSLGASLLNFVSWDQATGQVALRDGVASVSRSISGDLTVVAAQTAIVARATDTRNINIRIAAPQTLQLNPLFRPQPAVLAVGEELSIDFRDAVIAVSLTGLTFTCLLYTSPSPRD